MKICCLHGFGGAGFSFRGLKDHLPAEARVVAPDLAGHGGPEATTFDAEVERLAALLVTEGDADRPWHLVGYSMGGRLALGVALRALDQKQRGVAAPAIAQLLLIGANPGLGGEQERQARCLADDGWADRIRSAGTEAFFSAWRELPLFASQAQLEPTTLAEQERINHSHDRAQLAAAMSALSLGRMPDYSARLSELRSEACGFDTTWMAGTLDVKFTELAKQSARRSGGRFVAAADTGHNVPLEKPETVAKIIAEGGIQIDNA